MIPKKANLNRTAELLRQHEEKDQRQSRFVSAARERRQAQMEKLSKSLQYAQKKQTHIDMVSEVEQEKFFHFTFFDEKPVEKPAEPTPENIEEIDDDLVPLIPKSAIKETGVTSTSWAQKVEEEIAAGIYVLPGQEADIESMANYEMAKKEREHDGIFTGSEPIISRSV